MITLPGLLSKYISHSAWEEELFQDYSLGSGTVFEENYFMQDYNRRIIFLTVHGENYVRITFRITIFLRVHEENHKDVTAVNLILNEKSGRRIYSTVKKEVGVLER
jgi:hypothetical protein